jgi:hypothetical protein
VWLIVKSKLASCLGNIKYPIIEMSASIGLFAYHEATVAQMLVEYRQQVAESAAKKFENGRVRLRRGRSQKAARRHVTVQFVVVPEEPSQNLEALVLILAVEPAMTLGESEGAE